MAQRRRTWVDKARRGLAALVVALTSLIGGPAVLAAPAGQAPLSRGTVVALAGTPHLWFADEQGVLHWGGDTRALAGREIDWNRRIEVTLDQLRSYRRGDPWLSAGLLKIGDPIYLVKWETNEAQPTLLHIQSIADVELFGINGSNYGNFVLERAEWERRFGFNVDTLRKAELAPATSGGGGQTRARPPLTGKLVYYRGIGTWRMNADGSDQRLLIAGGIVPVLSRDGGRLAFMGPTSDGECCALWTGDSNGGSLRRVTNGPVDLLATWSPDGTRLAFSSNLSGGLKVYLVAANGGGQSLLLDWPGLIGLSWSPDGTKLAFASTTETTRGIYVVPIAGGSSFRLTQEIDEDPQWSPDGRQIAFSSRRDGNWEIYVMNADGSNVRRLTNESSDDFHPAWSPDGSYLAFVSARSGNQTDIYVMDAADGANVRNLTNTPNDDEQFISWAP